MNTTIRSQLILLKPSKIKYDDGNSWIIKLPKDIPLGDTVENQYISQIKLFENGEEVGPAHIPHEKIREHGNGRYSHWGNKLYFSSSDNTSPRKNKRNYSVMIPAQMYVEKSSAISSLLLDFDVTNLPKTERYELAKLFFRNTWGNSPLPDRGRAIEHDKIFNDNFLKVSPESDLSIERKYNLNQLLQLTVKINGDIAECGSHKGAAAFFMAQHIIDEKLNKDLCLFDSFQGLSEPNNIDGNYWASGDMSSSIGDVKNTLSNLGETPFVNIYQGWIPERFNEVDNRSFCFVHIDVDLYQPTLDSIEYFYPKTSAGGIILLDDYGFSSCPGVTESIDLFMQDKPEPIINLASGGAFIIKN